MIKIIRCVALIAGLLCMHSFVLAAPKTTASPTTAAPVADQPSDPYDRAGRLGLGVAMKSGFSAGPGVRYWFNNKFGIDAGGTFLVDKNGTDPEESYTFTGSLLYLLKQKAGLRLEGLFTGGVEHAIEKFDDTSSGFESVITTKEAFVGVGVGIEYSFQELPDLAFGGFITGLGIRWISETDNNSSSGVPNVSEESKKIRYLSEPDVALTMRYYF